MKAFVCCEHFQDENFKRKNKSELKKGSVPTIFKICEPNLTTYNSNHSPQPQPPQPLQQSQTDFEENTISSEIPPTAQVTAELSQPINENICLNHQCLSCYKKDELIEKYEIKIEELKKKLISARNKAYFLEKVKQKLNNTLLEMEQNKIINKKQWENLEVTAAVKKYSKIYISSLVLIFAFYIIYELFISIYCIYF